MSEATPRSFRLRLLVTAVAMLLGFALIGGYALLEFERSLLEAQATRDQYTQIREQAGLVQLSYAHQRLSWANLLLRGQESEQYYRYLPMFYDDERRTLVAAQNLVRQLHIAGGDLQDRAKILQTHLEEVRGAYRGALELYHQSGNSPVATDRFLNAAIRDPAGELDTIVELVERWHMDELHRIDEELGTRRLLVGAGILLWVAFSIAAMAWLIDHYYGRPLARAVGAARDIAAGRIEQRLTAGDAGEFAVFAATFNSMMDRLASSDHRLRESIMRLEAEVERRSAAERQLVLEQRALKAANEELESFSYSVSHDLRAPLRAIDGFSRAVQDEYGDRMDEETRRKMQRVRAGAQRMGLLIDDLLKVSQITRVPLRPGKVKLTAVAQEIIERLREAAPERRVEVVMEQGVEARGDRGLIAIVLENLLSNAWKYTSRRPDARIEFGTAVQDGETVFFVKDNGVGFDMQYAGGLFGPFQRLHNVNDFPGNGIGLATAQRIVRRHGGRMWAQAVPNEGACFYFTLDAPVINPVVPDGGAANDYNAKS